MFVMASLVVPGVVAAQQEPDDSLIEAEPAVGMCFNRTCTSNTQCRTWCDEPSARCVAVNLPPHYKFCELP